MNKEEYFERGEANTYYDLVPRERVELDMACGDGIVSTAAREYYKERYATPEERVKMDLDDLVNRISGITMVAVTLSMIIFALIQKLFG